MRKTKKSTIEDEKDEDEDDEEGDENPSTSIPLSADAWTSWYPQEWIGWVMYGTPCDKPTHHWVTQLISEGPSDEPTYHEDETGKKSSKKPPGRVLQRERANNDTTISRVSSDSNTMLSHRIVQSDREVRIVESTHDLKMINILRANADTDEKLQQVNEYYEEFLLNESELLGERMKERRALREKKQSDEKAKKEMENNKPSKRVLPIPSPINTTLKSNPNNTPTVATPSANDILYRHNDDSPYSGLENGREFCSQMDFSQDREEDDNNAQPSASSISKPIMDFSLICNSRVRTSSSVAPKSGRPPLAPPVAPPSSMLTRSRSPAAPNPLVNPYRGKDWEYINTALHRKYPMEKPGLISMKDFSFREGSQDLCDLKDLKKGEVEDDETCEMTMIWIKKLQLALKRFMGVSDTDSDSGSDNGSVYVGEDEADM